jgi:hypothetical protein
MFIVVLNSKGSAHQSIANFLGVPGGVNIFVERHTFWVFVAVLLTFFKKSLFTDLCKEFCKDSFTCTVKPVLTTISE